jgi:uncharacterized protein DUF6457
VDWLEDYAAALGASPLGADERRGLLQLAREVAHRTERVNAPLSTYLAGRFVAERVRSGAEPADAVREAFRLAGERLPEADRDEPAGR